MTKSYPGLSTRDSLSLCSTNGKTRRNDDTLRQASILIGLPDLHLKGSLGKERESSFFKTSHAMRRIAKTIQYSYDLMPTLLRENEVLLTRKPRENLETFLPQMFQNWTNQESFSPSLAIQPNH
jgi:hypothetical protein